MAALICVTASLQVHLRAQEGRQPLRVAAAPRFQPWIDYLNTQFSDLRFELYEVPGGDIVSAAESGKMDFILAAPTYFAVLEAEVGITALATLREAAGPGTFTNFLGGAIICRAENTSIHQLSDLRGKRFAAVDQLALGGWISAAKELRDEGIDLERDIQVHFRSTSEGVLDAVRSGLDDAGVVTTGTYEDLIGSGKMKRGELRVLPPREIYPEAVGFPLAHSTRLYPQVAFAALPHVPEPLMRRVALVLLRTPETSDVARNTKNGGWSLPIGYQSVQRAMMDVRVGTYRDLGKVTFSGALRQHWGKILVILLALVGLLAVISIRVVRLNRRLSDSQVALRTELELHRIAREKRQESEARFRSIFDQSGVGIYLATPDGKIIESNPAFQAMLGYSRGELASLGVLDLSHPDDREAERQAGCELLAGSRKSYELDKRCLRRDGVPVWVHFTGSLIRNTQGSIALVIGMVEDVTGRKQAEEERERLIQDLQKALGEVHALSGLLPICSRCKKIRDDQGYWKQVEVFIEEHAQVQFSHGICPTCMKKLYADYVDRI